ncbi:hypothetical protein FRB94_008752 [Tulasnella sp. JGI-2019a]|nr:hypothetical protein FRB94_008752 [Tulasnella sp. JGI-2019a]
MILRAILLLIHFQPRIAASESLVLTGVIAPTDAVMSTMSQISAASEATRMGVHQTSSTTFPTSGEVTAPACGAIAIRTRPYPTSPTALESPAPAALSNSSSASRMGGVPTTLGIFTVITHDNTERDQVSLDRTQGEPTNAERRAQDRGGPQGPEQ